MAYHEAPGSKGVAPKHSKTALDSASKKKATDISNAEIVPIQEVDVSYFDEEYLKERFLFNAHRVWGDVIDKIHFKFTKREPKKGHILSLAYSSRPIAIRNALISAPTEMTLYYSESLFDYSKEDAEKIIIHEVIHIGHPGHSEAFITEVMRFGGIKSMAHLEGLGIQVQTKVRKNKGERFKTIMTFKDDEEELAMNEANKYAREHRDKKVRLQY
ncbi:M48 family metallopeptidase [Candidatus Dependentiae bacterium]|nr:M48 family metallopeptidase [Candidatus Dependentiae bacterium]